MAALPLPAMGGEADHLPQSGRDRSAFISLTKLSNKIIYNFFCYRSPGGEERWRAEGGGPRHSQVGLAGQPPPSGLTGPPPPANRGGPPDFRQARAEVALRPCARALCVDTNIKENLLACQIIEPTQFGKGTSSEACIMLCQHTSSIMVL